MSCNDLALVIQPQVIMSIKSDDSFSMRDKETPMGSSEMFTESRIKQLLAHIICAESIFLAKMQSFVVRLIKINNPQVDLE